MKAILLIRHAKSSCAEPMQKDFERPLNERGHHDAPKMAKRLLHKDIIIDAFISSPAKRAFTTAKYFAEVYEHKEKKIIIAAELYEPSTKAFYNVISAADDNFDTIAIFSHNPGITDFVNELTEKRIDNLPTCSVFGAKADIKKWHEFNNVEKKFWFFDYPKLKD